MASCLAVLCGAVGTVRQRQDEDEPAKHATL